MGASEKLEATFHGRGGWCPDCDGRGEVDTGRREHDTGGVIAAPCFTCEGTGKVAEDES